jgi:hypothetical protein
MHFRDVYIPAYYADHLLTKLDKLKQDSRTVKEYYHFFKICIMFSGLDECMEDVMNSFMRGLNSEIQTLLISKSYSHIGQLFCLALNAEKKILSFVNSYKNDVTHNVQSLSTLHANCYRHNLARPEGGPRARWAQRIIVMGLRIGSCAGSLRQDWPCI